MPTIKHNGRVMHIITVYVVNVASLIIINHTSVLVFVAKFMKAKPVIDNPLLDRFII